MDENIHKLTRSPETYQQWLSCFEILKNTPFIEDDYMEAISKGTLQNDSPFITAQFQTKLVELVNELINNCITRFHKELGLLLSFGEFLDVAVLFSKLQREIKKHLILTEIEFLDVTFASLLSTSMTTQIDAFLDDVVSILNEQAMEHENDDLLYTLLQIKRTRRRNRQTLT